MPKQPVLDWIKRVDPNPPNLTLDQLRLEQNAFLVPDDLDGQQDAEKWVQRRWQIKWIHAGLEDDKRQRLLELYRQSNEKRVDEFPRFD